MQDVRRSKNQELEERNLLLRVKYFTFCFDDTVLLCELLAILLKSCRADHTAHRDANDQSAHLSKKIKLERVLLLSVLA